MGEIKPTPLDKAADRLGVVCADQAFKLRASIPGRTDDDDVVIGQGIVWARERIEHLEADRDRVGGIAKQRYAEIRGLKEDAREFDYVTMKLRGLLLFAKSARPREIVEAVVSTWYARLEVEGRQRKQLAEANATIERLTAENVELSTERQRIRGKLLDLQAEASDQILSLQDRIAELERDQQPAKPTPDWEPVAKALGCDRNCGFERRGTGLMCIQGDACGQFVGPWNAAFPALSGYHEANTGELRAELAKSQPNRKPPNLANMTLAEAAKARLAMGPGTFEDIACFVQAMREELADCVNYCAADEDRDGFRHSRRHVYLALEDAWAKVQLLEHEQQRWKQASRTPTPRGES